MLPNLFEFFFLFPPPLSRRGSLFEFAGFFTQIGKGQVFQNPEHT